MNKEPSYKEKDTLSIDLIKEETLKVSSLLSNEKETSDKKRA